MAPEFVGQAGTAAQRPSLDATDGVSRHGLAKPSVLDLPKLTEDSSYTLSVLRGFYGFYTEEPPLSTV